MKVSVPEFQLLPSVKYLDVEALSRASKVKIDVGYFKTPCCERYLRAVIEAGMVTSLEMDSCSDLIPAHSDLAAFAMTALKRAGRRVAGKWKPITVKEFLAGADEIKERETNCVEFTIFGRTIFCCQTGRGPVSCVLIEPIEAEPWKRWAPAPPRHSASAFMKSFVWN